MALHTDLLIQARRLATSEQKRPKQASLRRAVSTAYYGLFHFLIDEAVRFLISGNTAERRELRQQLARCFEHSKMKKASQAFAGRGSNAWKDMLPSKQVSRRLAETGDTFINLQEARHDADYNVRRVFYRSEVLAFIVQAEDAVKGWRHVQGAQEAKAFLLALLTSPRGG